MNNSIDDKLEKLFDAGVASNTTTEVNYVPAPAGDFIKRNLEAIKEAFRLLNDEEYVKRHLEW